MIKETGGPAFPVVGHWYGDKLGGQLTHGMTLRDYFAAKAMPWVLQEWRSVGMDDLYKTAATESYKIADAMLKARGEE